MTWQEVVSRIVCELAWVAFIATFAWLERAPRRAS
jgi:hypothetical protein